MLSRGHSRSRRDICSGFHWNHSSCSCHSSHLPQTDSLETHDNRDTRHYVITPSTHHMYQLQLQLECFADIVSTWWLWTDSDHLHFRPWQLHIQRLTYSRWRFTVVERRSLAGELQCPALDLQLVGDHLCG